MKLANYVLFYFLLFFSVIAMAQDTSVDSLVAALQKDPLFFEKVFIHTNKTKYDKEDTIWFKGYVSSSVNKPSLKTTLLYVSLFSETGQLIEEQNILINKGVGVGQFELFDTLEYGDYYIQAHTNFMKNFGDENTFVSKISIGNTAKNNGENNPVLYDLQLFPEGGYLLENVENVIAIKALVNGKGLDFTGEIVDSKNKVITSFENRYLGMTTCALFYDASEKYQAIIRIKDTVLKMDVPVAKKEGLSLKVIDRVDFVDMQLQTNRKTLQSQKDSYSVLFHQNNKLVNYADIVLRDTSKIILQINKNDFFNGVNTVTVFKKDTPILERKFFVYKDNAKIQVKVEKQLKEKDSSVFKLKMIAEAERANLSVSVMSSKTQIEEETTIESAFLLTPYIKGYIEKPSYYLDEKNINRLQHADLLLLTQGWTQYTTSRFVNNVNPKYKYDFELGFKLSGHAAPLGSNNLALISEDNKVIDKIFLNNKLDFTFKNLLIYKGDAVKLSFVKPDNELAKPENMTLDSVVHSKLEFKPIVLKSNYTSVAIEKEDDFVFYEADATRLDTVNVTGRIKTKAYLEKTKLVRKYKKITFDIGKYMPLEVADRYKKELFLGYLERAEGARLVNWKGLEWYLELGVEKEAFLFIDGKRMESEDLGGLKLEMKDVENVMVQPLKKGFRAYQVFTTDNYKKGIVELYQNYVFEYGYNTAKKYYTPIHDFNFQNEATEIDWKPILETNTNGEAIFKVKNNSSGYTFSIQGFTKSGKLISEIIVVE
ncbi:MULTISPECIES: hypothetical protein [unclassified Lacinutrix]